MHLDDYLEASEEQSELLEELKKLIEQLEEAPADELMKERILHILDRLARLRKKLRSLAREEAEGDMALLQEFYRLVGVHDERMVLEDLLKQVVKGRIDIPHETVLQHINELKEMSKEFEEGEGRE